VPESLRALLTEALPLLLGLPLLAAGATVLMRSVVARRVVGLATAALVLVYAGLLLWATSDGSVLAEQVSGWPAGVSITFAADTFTGLMVAVAALLVLVGSWYAIRSGDDTDLHFVPLVLVMSGGVYGAFATADLFNLFVMVEVALIPSYVLLTRSGRPGAVAAGRVYLTVNLLVSTVLLTGIALLYGVTGTVNLGQLAGAAAESTSAAVAGAVVLVALAGKAALVPVHSWLPRTYPHASTAVNAMISGLLTKIGVYGLFRVYSVVYDGDSRWALVAQVVLVATMTIGVLGALGETSVRAVLAFHMVSQVGYILLGLGFFGVVGLAAGIFYLVHHIIVKAALFFVVGAVEETRGTGDLKRLGGVARKEPLLAFAFLGAALSLTGIPPFSGFVAKYSLIRGAVEEGALVAAGFALVVSVFTLLSMMKLWNGVFWGKDPAADRAAERPRAADGQEPAPEPAPERRTVATTGPTPTSPAQPAAVAGTAPTGTPAPSGDAAAEPPRARIPLGLVLPGTVLALTSLLIGLGAQGLMGLSVTAAENLVDTTRYVEAVTAP
ncbi:proton-conducting transporter transmembrane domain-containing protein, partial [Actinosynnema sp.]|uniref:monovalent cation/H+ antiporter subunit D family protein n=1 Tax=Actinosynnema sp. TaxID=1872144 RepID=UPI003F87A19E